VSPGVKVWT